jgi:hypothetical protein
MTTSDECCGWLGWAQLAGIGADGARLNDAATEATTMPPVAAKTHALPFITAVLRRVLHDRDRGAPPR